jgi:hypothetical protein
MTLGGMYIIARQNRYIKLASNVVYKDKTKCRAHKMIEANLSTKARLYAKDKIPLIDKSPFFHSGGYTYCMVARQNHYI